MLKKIFTTKLNKVNCINNAVELWIELNQLSLEAELALYPDVKDKQSFSLWLILLLIYTPYNC